MRHLRERAESVDYTDMLMLPEKETKPQAKEDADTMKTVKPKKLKPKKKKETQNDDDEEDFEEREPKKKPKKRPAAASHKDDDDDPLREPIKKKKKKPLTSSQLDDEDLVREPVKKKKKKPLASSQKNDKPAREPIKKKKKPEDVKSEPIDVDALDASVGHVAEPLTRKEYESMKKVVELHKKEVELMMQKANAVSQEQKKTYEEIISELKAEAESLSKKLKQKKQQDAKASEKTKALEALEKKQADAKEETRILRQRIKELEGQLSESKKAARADAKTMAAAAAKSAASAVRSGEENVRLARALKLLQLYRTVTSTDIRLIESEGDDDEADNETLELACTAIDSASGRKFQFELAVPSSESDEIEYLPSEHPTKGIHVPSYLREELSFKRAEMTKFMRSALDVVINGKK